MQKQTSSQANQGQEVPINIEDAAEDEDYEALDVTNEDLALQEQDEAAAQDEDAENIENDERPDTAELQDFVVVR